MAQYRIKEVAIEGRETRYYPQYKDLFWWFTCKEYYEDGLPRGTYAKVFLSLSEAEQYIYDKIAKKKALKNKKITYHD